MADNISVPITEESITVEITGGLTSHPGLSGLDFASAGHTGPLPMGHTQITELADATQPSGAANLGQVTSAVSGFLARSGGIMTGDILGAVNHGASGTRVTKVWTENIDSANLPTINGATLVASLINTGIDEIEFSLINSYRI